MSSRHHHSSDNNNIDIRSLIIEGKAVFVWTTITLLLRAFLICLLSLASLQNNSNNEDDYKLMMIYEVDYKGVETGLFSNVKNDILQIFSMVADLLTSFLPKDSTFVFWSAWTLYPISVSYLLSKCNYDSCIE